MSTSIIHRNIEDPRNLVSRGTVQLKQCPQDSGPVHISRHLPRSGRSRVFRKRVFAMSHMGKGLAWTEVGAFIPHALFTIGRVVGGAGRRHCGQAIIRRQDGTPAARLAPVATSAMQSNRHRNAPAYTAMEITIVTCIDLKFHRCPFGNPLDPSNRQPTTSLGPARRG